MIAQLIAYLMDFAVLWLVAWATPARGWPLFASLYALMVGVGIVNLLIEALVFEVIGWPEALTGGATQAAVFAIIAAAATLLAPNPAVGDAPTLRIGPLRLAGMMAAYVVLYFIAGMLVYPYIARFYEGHYLPGFGELVTLQAFRACVFAASCVLLLRSGLRYAPLLLGVAFSVIGGLAPLLPEHPNMPPEMRGPHAIEVGVSNFLFGVITGWLLTRRLTKPAMAR